MITLTSALLIAGGAAAVCFAAGAVLGWVVATLHVMDLEDGR